MSDTATAVSPRARRKRDSDSDDEEILREARDRHKQGMDWEGEFRQSFTDDVRFCNGDADNRWQWPDTYLDDRDGQNRPSLTVNKTRQHCLQIINDARQNKPQVRITAVSDEATKEAADVFEGIVRHIEYISDATTAYDTATEHQVQGGIGWWRIITRYEGTTSFDQEIRIQRVRDALSVLMDNDIQEVDGSDARWAFIGEDVARDEFETKYPEYKDAIPQTGFGFIDGGWLDEDHVRVVEYFRRSQDSDTLHMLPDGSTLRESELDDPDVKRQVREISTRKRDITEDRVEWFKIVGGTIVERGDWPGKYIPLVRVIGEETVIEGRLERKGHTRALKDPQRIYNYWSSSGVESVALQTKTPWIAATESIENFQRYWDTANTENHSVLPFNARDDKGQPLPPPTRMDPPQMAQAYIQGMQIAQTEMMLVSGQYQTQMGAPSNEQTGKAIQERQRTGETATYHFIDNLATAIRFTGRILIDLIPKVYDTPRILRILQADGSVDRVQLDPQCPQACAQAPAAHALQPGVSPMQQAPGAPGAPPGPQPGLQVPPPTPQQQMAQSVTRIFNPKVGQYAVIAEVGPSYATRRQEAFSAFTQIIAASPGLLQVAGDLLFKAADFPMAEDLAERLARMVPPQALGTGPSPDALQAQQALQGAQAHVALLSEKLAVAEMKLKAKDEGRDLEGYKAVTTRLSTLLNAADTDSPYVSPDELRTLIRDLVLDAMATSNVVSGIDQANMASIAGSGGPPGMPGAPPGGGQSGMPPGPPGGAPGPGMGMPPPMHPLAPPGTPPGVHPGVFNGQHAALSPVRPPMPPPGR
jgi:hypothetical protein